VHASRLHGIIRGFIFALVPDRENQKAAILGRTLGYSLRSSVIARIKKQPSVAALFKLAFFGVIEND
jgi:hypothetical protein